MKDISVDNSKFLSLILRHNPGLISLELDENGWANVDELILRMNNHGKFMDFETLKNVVENNNKQRFTFNQDLTKIRANQGHSIPVDLELNEVEPVRDLYHGTVQDFMDAILKDGLKKMNRTHVHLSKDIDTAIIVAQRRGKPIVLQIDACQMHKDGYKFYLSKNEVWLTDHVLPKYLKIK